MATNSFEQIEFSVMYEPAIREAGIDPDSVSEEDIDRLVVEIFGEDDGQADPAQE